MKIKLIVLLLLCLSVGDIHALIINSDDVTLLQEFGGYLSHERNYYGVQRRYMKMDVINIKNFSLGFEFNEETLLGESGSPHNIRHDLKYGYIRYDHEYASLGIFYDHSCINGMRRSDMKVGWDVIGLEIQSRNMRINQVNSGIDFSSAEDWEFLSAFGYHLYLSRILSSRLLDFDNLGKANIRWDVLRYRNMVPYLQGGVSVFQGPGWNGHYSVELGSRFSLSSVSVSPFLQWQYAQEIDEWPEMKGHSYMAGIRWHTLAQGESRNHVNKKYDFFNTMHFEGFYSRILNSENFHYQANMKIDTEIFRSEDWRTILTTRVNNLTPNDEFRPRYTRFFIEPRLGKESEGRYYELFFRHFSRYCVNVDEDEFSVEDGVIHSGLLGIAVGTQGARTGYKNYGIDFESYSKREFLNNYHWHFAGGGYVYDKNYDYYALLESYARWDIFRYKRVVPYLAKIMNIHLGRDSDSEHFLEAGTRMALKSGLNISYFMQYQHNNHAVRFNDDYKSGFLMTGLRFEY